MKKRIGVFLLVLVLLLSMLCCLGSGETDRDPSHYNYYPCTHCGGSGKTKSGAECGWCNGTGMYAVKKSQYDD